MPSRRQDETDDLLNRSGAGLSASAMLGASPTQHGLAYKLHVPLLFSMCPTFLQRLICSVGFLSWLLAPQWKERYLIQIGSFLYKFKDSQASNPKGTPLPLEAIDAEMVSSTMSLEGAEFAMNRLPPGCNSVFMAATLRKKHFYAVSSREDALAWTNSLHQGRQETVTRTMGHASNMPYPKSWDYFDKLGANYVKTKDRIRRKIEEVSAREIEVSKLGDGGPAPRGYFG